MKEGWSFVQGIVYVAIQRKGGRESGLERGVVLWSGGKGHRNTSLKEGQSVIKGFSMQKDEEKAVEKVVVKERWSMGFCA